MEVLHRIIALKLASFTLEEISRINSGADEEAVLLKKKSELLAKLSDLKTDSRGGRVPVKRENRSVRPRTDQNHPGNYRGLYANPAGIL